MIIAPLRNDPRITQHYGERPEYYARFNLRGHNGIDYAAPIGTPVHAVAAGEVRWVDSDPTGYGDYIRIWHPTLRVHSFYGHLSEQLDGSGSAVAAGVVELRTGPAAVELWAPIDRGYGRLRIKLTDQQTNISGSSDLGNAQGAEAALAALGKQALEVEEAVESARTREAEAEARREEKRKQHAAALERGRKGAELLLRVAREHAEIQAAQREAAKAWAEEWTQRLWQPWSGWEVRYVPVGQRVETEEDAVVQTVVVLDDLAEIVAQSPGAAVRVVSPGGHVSERVIGAFLDATPVEHDMPALASAEPFHRSYGGCFSYFVNVPPTVQGEPERAPGCIGWFDYVAGRLGVLHAERLAYEMRLEPAALAKMDVEQLADWWQVQELAEVEI